MIVDYQLGEGGSFYKESILYPTAREPRVIYGHARLHALTLLKEHPEYQHCFIEYFENATDMAPRYLVETDCVFNLNWKEPSCDK